MELTERLPFEAGPQISDEDLCSLMKSHSLALETCRISKARELLYDEIDQRSSGAVHGRDAVREATAKVLSLSASSLLKSHELVLGIAPGPPHEDIAAFPQGVVSSLY